MQATEDALVSIVQSRRVRRWLWTILFLLALVVFVRSSIIDINVVPSGSMSPTIKTGEHILIDKLAYDLKFPLTKLHVASWGNPKSGDIILFDSPATGIRLVKRVVAVGGDRLVVTGNVLRINDVPCTYHVSGDTTTETLGTLQHRIFAHFIASSAALEKTVILPPNTFFTMGDNRDNSADSRVFGPVPRSKILGQVIRIF